MFTALNTSFSLVAVVIVSWCISFNPMHIYRIGSCAALSYLAVQYLIQEHSYLIPNSERLRTLVKNVSHAFRFESSVHVTEYRFNISIPQQAMWLDNFFFWIWSAMLYKREILSLHLNWLSWLRPLRQCTSWCYMSLCSLSCRFTSYFSYDHTKSPWIAFRRSEMHCKSTARSWTLDEWHCWTQRIRFAPLLHMQKWFSSVCPNCKHRLFNLEVVVVKSTLDPFPTTTYVLLLMLVNLLHSAEDLRAFSTIITVRH